MRDISQKIGTNQFARVRVGSGKPVHGEDLANYVLGGFKKEELSEIEASINLASEAILEILNKGIHSAMNHFN